MPTPKVFISYRRSDAAAVAGRIHDRLAPAIGKANVFKDSYDIHPGEDFRGRIRDGVGQCDVVLVVIGPTWLNVTEKDTAQRRLDNPNDWVRIEVETALQRSGSGVKVIPVLVQGASMPGANELPDSLRELAYKNAIPLRDDPDFNADTTKLIESINKPRSAIGMPVIAAIAVILVLVVAGVLLLSSQNNGNPVAAVPSNTPDNVVAATNTVALPSNTPQSSSPTEKPQTVPTEASVVETNAPPATSVPIVVPENERLHLYVTADSLTLFVSADAPVDVSKLAFQGTVDGKVYELIKDFPSLQFKKGLADPGSCFIYQRSGKTPPVSSNCVVTSLFRKDVAVSDVFWYDVAGNLQRTIAILPDGVTLQTCSETNPDCAIP